MWSDLSIYQPFLWIVRISRFSGFIRSYVWIHRLFLCTLENFLCRKALLCSGLRSHMSMCLSARCIVHLSEEPPKPELRISVGIIRITVDLVYPPQRWSIKFKRTSNHLNDLEKFGKHSSLISFSFHSDRGYKKKKSFTNDFCNRLNLLKYEDIILRICL